MTDDLTPKTPISTAGDTNSQNRGLPRWSWWVGGIGTAIVISSLSFFGGMAVGNSDGPGPGRIGFERPDQMPPGFPENQPDFPSAPPNLESGKQDDSQSQSDANTN